MKIQLSEHIKILVDLTPFVFMCLTPEKYYSTFMFIFTFKWLSSPAAWFENRIEEARETRSICLEVRSSVHLHQIPEKASKINKLNR